jgi:hypothetical protein
VTGRIGLIPLPGGFGTPEFADRERVRVDGVELVREVAGVAQRTPLSTLAAAARFAGVDLGVPTGVYETKTPLRPDDPLGLDPAAAGALADWYALGARALDEVRGGRADASVVLWPEHFDAACDLGDESNRSRVTCGASPGDDAIPEPYLYVSPWEPSLHTGPLGEYAFGGAITYGTLAGAAAGPDAAAVEFLRGALALLPT